MTYLPPTESRFCFREIIRSAIVLFLS